MSEKPIIYQVLPRLFGNKNTNRKPNGTLQENGSGKFNDFTKNVLLQIKQLGITHIWYTGIIRHATKNNYTKNKIPFQTPSIVKGNAGSPYAITDYYDVDPDLSVDVENRIEEFKQLILRTHDAGMKVIIDFVPNHVAREYKSIHKPLCGNLGENDDTSQGFSLQNNFYYLPNQTFSPSFNIGNYIEKPAKATGNDCFCNSPNENDWYETVKLNYGVNHFAGENTYHHFENTPDTWHKMLDILLYWSNFGVDGFRCDMAEMVPIEFWKYAIKRVKNKHKHIIFIAEVYNSATYESHIAAGFNLLYDKVGMYECMRNVICHNLPTQNITREWQKTDLINDNLLYFLENHDEQRIASSHFCSNAKAALPAFSTMALMRKNAVMLYFAQEFGEEAQYSEGYSGADGRTTIFDYWSIDKIIRGYFEHKLTEEEQSLRNFYAKTLAIVCKEEAIKQGLFFDLMYVNPQLSQKQYAFMRKHKEECILIIANFAQNVRQVEINIPQHALDYLKIKPQIAKATNLFNNQKQSLNISTTNTLNITLQPFETQALKFKQ